jgi:UDP-2,3-diacylglucosamine pyrophosphatase LpxH
VPTSRQPNHGRGIVISDLHLFARRSLGAARLEGLRAELAEVDFLVLNGDIFDFRWSTLRSHETTQAAALEWLRRLVNDFRKCQVHFVMGNHDCLAPFRHGLDGLAAALPRFQWHEHWLRLGPALFLHGDCAHVKMDAGEFHRYREAWRRDRQHGACRAAAYSCVDRLGFTQLAQTCQFPRRRTVQRIVYHLDQACPGWRRGLRDCYFGHTHVPFSNYRHDGLTFHNTGSAVRHMAFKPIFFELPRGDGATGSSNRP